METKDKCPICCFSDIAESRNFDGERSYINCPVCGTYILPLTSTFRKEGKHCADFGAVYDADKLTAYLYHNKMEERRAFIGSESAYNSYKTSNPQTTAFWVTPETVDNWYPKTFEERINNILLLLAKQSKYIGDSVKIDIEEFNPFFFLCNVPKSDGWRKEVRFLFRYLSDDGLWEYPITNDKYGAFITNLEFQGFTSFTLSAKGWSIVYDIQRNYSTSKTAFVAMKFGDETVELRNMIRKGIEDAGYAAIFMDEIEHNHQIVPEMLNAIKRSRFVVAELSHHNNGAYYEAGYALGLNKEVIHICSEEALKKDLHFDVAQICTVKYDKLDEIPERLKKRIEATVF